MTRIIAGRARSARLAVPRTGTRPTSERVREAIFSSLDSWDAVAGARVLDLYAGSGALGLEAASRGAASVVLVERNTKAAALCRANADVVRRALGVKGEGLPVTVAPHSVRSYLSTAGDAVDLVLIDPPYDLGDDDLAQDLDAVSRLVSPDAVIVVERSTRSPEPRWPSGVEPLRSRDYGETRVWFASPETEETVAEDDAPTITGSTET
ncbi:16S rRNA (guanine(966)-N(2))-methyltransferase RsmD [Labedella populi]|uniref:16S rRNA (Guanine(966)-N(2))-methyltransferase RsmD n=1 Tax=Labedella populi TaxID=2498850 RepID=A0A444QAM2_9MICO|nr:16S rRNA (guanine(966)-N(2))-methyltransferase RsmD [Labedella populi]RWZ61128.1 16S rRNA (guanine(966)-N(2))-methyltransferase RsmD [Labedella populi]